MSGIVGIFYLDERPVELSDLRKMTGILAHRGPDGEGIWHNGSVGLGHRMLWATPESLKEQQPRVSRNGRLVITADARIDNRDELIRALDISDRKPAEITDSELILAAYGKWSEYCAEKLLGDFAFAIWDGFRRHLFCARDPMGIKPFYYYNAGGAFVFTSEIKAILSLNEIPRKLNEVKVADGLVPIFNDQVSTYYEGILRLPPAHCMSVGYNKIQPRSYWNLDPSRELRLSTDQDYVDGFLEIFDEAVRCRLRSAFPVGSTLSGGLDSSSIACTAEKMLAGNGGDFLHTFSAIFPNVAKEDPRIDERPFIETVLANGEFVPHYVRADQCNPFSDVALHEDEVLAAPNFYMVSPLFCSAQQHGIRVLLSGFDGDVTVWHGFEYLDELARSGKWANFAREAHDISRRFGGNPLSHFQHHGIPYLTELARKRHWWTFMKQADEVSDHFALSRLQVIFNAGIKPTVPNPVRRAWQLLHGGRKPASPLKGLNIAINPTFAKRIGIAERIQSITAKASKSAHYLREKHVVGLMSGDIQYLAGMFDQTAAKFALEQRYPFFDRRLMEFCVALPFEQKLRQGWTRAILRRAMANFLPPKVKCRTDKGNISLNIRRRLLEDRETLDSIILHDTGVIEEYVDVPTLRAVYHRFISQPPATIGEKDLFTIYLSVTLALWLIQAEEFL